MSMISFWDVTKAEKLWSWESDPGALKIEDIDISRDGNLIFASDAIDRCYVFSSSNGRLRWTRNNLNGGPGAFLSNSRFLLAKERRDLIVSDSNTGKILHRITYEDLGENINSLAVSPDGQHVLLGSFDGKVLLWRVPSKFCSSDPQQEAAPVEEE